ncbi:hypothetical protein WBJ53_10875 [Spirosoma sp. SC4-14]
MRSVNTHLKEEDKPLLSVYGQHLFTTGQARPQFSKQKTGP